MFISYQAPHGPIEYEESYLRAIRRETQGIEGSRLYYAALVYGLDLSIGNVINALKEKGKVSNIKHTYTYKNTFAFFCVGNKRCSFFV